MRLQPQRERANVRHAPKDVHGASARVYWKKVMHSRLKKFMGQRHLVTSRVSMGFKMAVVQVYFSNPQTCPKIRPSGGSNLVRKENLDHFDGEVICFSKGDSKVL